MKKILFFIAIMMLSIDAYSYQNAIPVDGNGTQIGTTNNPLHATLTGNIGIGTARPSATLDVEGTLSTALFQGNGVGTGTLTPAIGVGTSHPFGYVEVNMGSQGGPTQWALSIIGNNAGVTGLGDNNSNILVSNSNSAGFAEYNATNNLGPGSDIIGLGISGSTANSHNTYPGAAYIYTTGSTPFAISANATVNTIPGIIVTTANNVGIGTFGPTTSQPFEIGNAQFDIMANGNIGIGTINPTAQVQAVASSPIINSTSNNAGGLGALAAFNSSGDESAIVCTGTSYAIPRTCGVLTSAGRPFNFGNFSGSIFQTIDSNGNIGIGSANPDSILNIPSLKSTTGTRYICIGTTGRITSSASACSGT